MNQERCSLLPPLPSFFPRSRISLKSAKLDPFLLWFTFFLWDTRYSKNKILDIFLVKKKVIEILRNPWFQKFCFNKLNFYVYWKPIFCEIRGVPKKSTKSFFFKYHQRKSCWNCAKSALRTILILSNKNLDWTQCKFLWNSWSTRNNFDSFFCYWKLKTTRQQNFCEIRAPV